MRTGLHDRRWDLDLGIGRSPGSTSASLAGSRMAVQMETEPSTASTATTATTTTGDSSLRRTVSSGDTTSLRSSQTSPPPHPPPKDPIPRRPPDPSFAESPTLLQSARLKMSSKDQEAMRKLRLTMDMSDSGSSGGSKSPLSPSFGNGGGGGSSSSHSQGHGRPTMGSRRSTLSRQVVSEDLDDGPTLPIAAQHVSDLSLCACSSLTEGAKSDQTQTVPQASADFVIAVIGHKGVGKSTVIRRATKVWGVSSPTSTTTDGGYTSQLIVSFTDCPGLSAEHSLSLLLFLSDSARRENQAGVESRVSRDEPRASPARS